MLISARRATICPCSCKQLLNSRADSRSRWSRWSRSSIRWRSTRYGRDCTISSSWSFSSSAWDLSRLSIRAPLEILLKVWKVILRIPNIILLQQVIEHPTRCSHHVSNHQGELRHLPLQLHRSLTRLQQFFKVDHHYVDDLKLHLLHRLTIATRIRRS